MTDPSFEVPDGVKIALVFGREIDGASQVGSCRPTALLLYSSMSGAAKAHLLCTATSAAAQRCASTSFATFATRRAG